VIAPKKKIKMHIGIDLSSTVEKETGKITSIGYYAYELVKGLSKVDKENEYILFHSFLPKGKRVPCSINQDNFKSRVFKFPHRILDFCWNNLHLLPLEDLIGNINIFHSPSFTFPLSKRIKRVVTVHGLGFSKYPELFPREEVRTLRKIRKFLPKVDRLIAVSCSIREELKEILGISPRKINIVYHGINEIFHPIKDKEKIAEKLSQYGISGKYIISVGKLEPAKNFGRLIDAFSEIGKLGGNLLKLVIVGAPYYQYDELFQKTRKLKLDNKVIFTGYLSPDELPYLYSGAELFLRPSLYEGCSLPLLEAMACGLPVVTSNISSFSEIVGDAGILVDPYDVEEIAEAVYNVLSNKESAEEMRRKGLEKAKQFSWEKCAKETLKVYEEVLKDG